MDDALDGVYRCDADGVPAFVETDAPNDDQLHALLHSTNGSATLAEAVGVAFSAATARDAANCGSWRSVA